MYLSYKIKVSLVVYIIQTTWLYWKISNHDNFIQRILKAYYDIYDNTSIVKQNWMQTLESTIQSAIKRISFELKGLKRNQPLSIGKGRCNNIYFLPCHICFGYVLNGVYAGGSNYMKIMSRGMNYWEHHTSPSPY